MMAICEVYHVRDAVELLASDAVLDFVDYFLRTDEVGKFCDRDPHFARGNASNGDPSSGLEASTPCFVCFADAV